MALRVVWSGYGRPAAVALRDAVAEAKAGEPLAPVAVVVPSNHVGVAARRLLSSGELGPVAGRGVGLAAVTFLTVYRLAELLGAATLAGQGKRPVSTPVLTAAVRAVLDEAPGLFEPVRSHPATEGALVSTYRELRDLSPAALDAIAATGERAREVVRVHRATRSRLEARWSDEQDLLAAATELAGSPAARELGALVVHLPQRLSLHGARLIRALADHVPTTVVAGCTGVDGADAQVRRSLERLGLPDEGGTAVGDPAPVAADRTLVVTASDADEEVRAAVREVIEAVHAGTPLDRVAVLHASAEPYARLAHEQLRAAGVPTNGAAVVPLAGRMAGRTLLELLALADHDFRRHDVFTWLAGAPIHADGRWVPTTAWERVSREAAVVGGRHDWDELLARYERQQEERAAELRRQDDAPEGWARRAEKRAEQARQLRAFVLGQMGDLQRAAAGARPWSQHAAWARQRLARLLPPRERERWPDEERKAAERVDLALLRLAALDEIEGPVPLEVFTRTLQVELEDDLGRVGRLGTGVLVGSVEMGIGLDLDLVVVLGLAEGSFPATVRDDSLLPDHERTAAGDELPLRAERVAQQHRQLLASLAGARRQVMCVPRGDLRRSADRVPSRWVLDLARHLAGGARWWAPDLLAADVPWVRHVHSFDHGLRTMAAPATDQEHRLRALLAAGGSLAATHDPATRQGHDVAAARRSDRFTRFDGNLAGVAVPSPVDRTTSPTRLERWATCPHAHLVLDLLKVTPIENPEDELEITPLEKGSLIHDILEDFICAVLERPEDQRPGPADAWTAQDRALLQEIGTRRCAEREAAGLTGRPVFWERERRRILRDLDTFLAVDQAYRREHGTTPVAAELGFGDMGDVPAVEVPLPDGRTLRFRGRIDRVDVGHDGTIHVVDYKTGKAKDFTQLTEAEPVLGGTKLQLPVYGLAGRLHQGRPDAPVRADYWFTTAAGRFSRRGYHVTDAVLERAREVLASIVEGIESGVFPPHPDGRSTFFYVACEVCDPDGLGTVDLRRQHDRKKADPAMRAFVRLAEGDHEEPEAAG